VTRFEPESRCAGIWPVLAHFRTVRCFTRSSSAASDAVSHSEVMIHGCSPNGSANGSCANRGKFAHGAFLTQRPQPWIYGFDCGVWLDLSGTHGALHKRDCWFCQNAGGQQRGNYACDMSACLLRPGGGAPQHRRPKGCACPSRATGWLWNGAQCFSRLVMVSWHWVRARATQFIARPIPVCLLPRPERQHSMNALSLRRRHANNASGLSKTWEGCFDYHSVPHTV